MYEYFLFAILATITILSPGPGVLLTLSNALRYGVSGAIGGICGIAFGTFIVAGISATSVGILLVTSATLFTVMKFIGAAYLIYLGIKLWQSPAINIDTNMATKKEMKRQFVEGVSIQLTNPKTVFFFLSVFPQFTNITAGFMAQFMLLVATYSGIVLIIHLLYAYLAKWARHWFSSERGSTIVNRAGGGMFMVFGLGLASASR